MNKLECQVTTCQHYCDNLCCLNGIQVEGPAARDSEQTCCASFEERTTGGWGNSVGERKPSQESDIQCEAKHCIYNNHCKCEAEDVCVGCLCGDVTVKSGTECCTFEPKI